MSTNPAESPLTKNSGEYKDLPQLKKQVTELLIRNGRRTVARDGGKETIQYVIESDRIRATLASINYYDSGGNLDAIARDNIEVTFGGEVVFQVGVTEFGYETILRSDKDWLECLRTAQNAPTAEELTVVAQGVGKKIEKFLHVHGETQRDSEIKGETKLTYDGQSQLSIDWTSQTYYDRSGEPDAYSDHLIVKFYGKTVFERSGLNVTTYNPGQWEKLILV